MGNVEPQKRFRPLFGLILVLGVTVPREGTAQAPKPDFAQADLMLRLIDRAGSGALSTGLIDSVLAARGTELVIAQQNISRQVNRDQYRTLMERLAGSAEFPAIGPAGPGV